MGLWDRWEPCTHSELTVLHRHHHHSTSGGLHGEEDVGKEEEEGSDPSDAASPQVSTWEGDLGDSPGAAAAAATGRVARRKPRGRGVRGCCRWVRRCCLGTWDAVRLRGAVGV